MRPHDDPPSPSPRFSTRPDFIPIWQRVPDRILALSLEEKLAKIRAYEPNSYEAFHAIADHVLQRIWKDTKGCAQ